jgi:hypothetical protein
MSTACSLIRFVRRQAAMSLIASLFLFAACTAEPECVVDGDCPSDKVCRQERCVDRPGYVRRRTTCDAADCAGSLFRDSAASVDTGGGAGLSDGSQTSTSGMNLDGGGGSTGDGSASATYDAGFYDGPALPIVDGGSTYDGGHATPQAVGNEGEIWISEINTESGPTSVVGARFDDHAGALFGITRRSFSVSSGECTVTERRLSSGASAGIEAARIVLDYTDNPRAMPVALTSPANNGRFAAATPPSPPLFLDHRPVDFSIVANGNIGSLLGHTAMVSIPKTPHIVVPASAGDGFSVVTNPAIEWLSNPGSGADLKLIAELADLDRNVVLRCEVTDSAGRLQIPGSALQAWSLSSPAAPVRLELRYDQTVSDTVGRSGGFVVDTIFRVSRGQSHPLVP